MCKKSNTSSTVNTETCSSDIITPSVTSVIPNDGVSSVALDTNISITFSIKMDDRFVKASTIGSCAFQVFRFPLIIFQVV